MTALEVASVYVGINILLLVWLAIRVVMGRVKGQVEHGDGASSALMTTIRIHGNASEYVPAMLVGLVVFAMMSGPIWAVHTLGIMFTAGRVLHPFGMSGGPILLPQAGIILSWLAMISVAVALIYFALT